MDQLLMITFEHCAPCATLAKVILNPMNKTKAGIVHPTNTKQKFSVSSVPSVAIIKNMVAMNEIERFGRRIGEEFGAEKVILFGSYANGTAQKDSDVDLLVRTPEKIRQRLEFGDQFIKDILKGGKVLYEADNR